MTDTMPERIWAGEFDPHEHYAEKMWSEHQDEEYHSLYYSADYVRRLMRCVVDLDHVATIYKPGEKGFVVNTTPQIAKSCEDVLLKHADLISQCRKEVEKGE